MSEFRARGGGMDRDTLMDDLDLILERSRDELPGEWDWEPPLGMGGPVAISASEPRDAAVDGPGDETDDEAEDYADNEEAEQEAEEEEEEEDD
jgi:hypothetical protein